MNADQLAALVAVVDEGTFEAAADALHVTPSAISQRIKALEQAVGNVVVRRSVPVTPTDAGAVLLRMARQVGFLEAETRAELGLDAAGSALPVAVNADSLATWFRPLLAAAASWPDATLHLHVDDQERSAALLRRGDVVGAVTAEPAPVNGCRAEPLGAMRYVPLAAPALLERHAVGGDPGRPDWAALPVLRFNEVDDLQVAYLRERGVRTTPPTSRIPSTEGFFDGVKAGLGWGLIPELQLAGEVERGDLVRLEGEATEVRLYWQSWRLSSTRLDRLTDAVRAAASGLS